MLILMELVEVLEKEDPSWRSNSVVLMDNARYHKTPQVMQLLKNLRIPTIFAAPYSPSCCFIELIFGALKRGDHNP